MSNSAAWLIVLRLLVPTGFLRVVLAGNSANALSRQLPAYQAKLNGDLDGVFAFLSAAGRK